MPRRSFSPRHSRARERVVILFFLVFDFSTRAGRFAASRAIMIA